MNRRLRRALAICALSAAALTAPSLADLAAPRMDTAWGAGQTTDDTAWGTPPADGGTTNPTLPALLTLPPITPLDTAWG